MIIFEIKNKLIKHEFDIVLKILEVHYIGDISLTELKEYGEMVRLNEDLPRDLKILTNATKANYKLASTDITLMFNDLKEQIKPYNSVKTAVIQAKPVETALSMLVDSEKPLPNYSHKVFSTRDAALKWLIS